MTIETISNNALKVVMPSKLTADEVGMLAARLDEAIARSGKIRVLFDLTSFGGWENMEALGAHIDQLKFVHERIEHIDRIAVVTGHPWQQQLFAWIGSVAHVPVKAFEKAQESAAADWIVA